MNTEYLMDGVRVLCEHQAEKIWSVWLYIAMIMLVVFLAAFISGVLTVRDEIFFVTVRDEIFFVLVISFALSFSLGIMFGSVIHQADVENALPLRYDVTIDKNVNFVEFDRRFYVIEQNGEIYTIAYRTEEERVK